MDLQFGKELLALNAKLLLLFLLYIQAKQWEKRLYLSFGRSFHIKLNDTITDPHLSNPPAAV